jgi:hypothetical protein
LTGIKIERAGLDINKSNSARMGGHIIVKAKEHSGVDDLGDIYLLYRTETVEIDGDHYMVCYPVQNPQKLVGNSQWITHAEDGPLQKVWHYRKASIVSDAAKYLDTMKRLKKSIMLEGIGEVFVWNLDKPNTILPGTYYHVCNGLDTAKFWHFSVTSPTKIAVPKHVLHTFMESSIDKGVECPITMEKLIKDNIAYTVCGHLFERGGIDTAVRVSGKCPTCRTPLGSADICGW